MTPKTAELGTLIHATLRSEDLLPAFTDELRRLSESAGNAKDIALCDEIDAELAALDTLAEVDGLEDVADTYWVSEHVSFLINEDLMNRLNDYAPPYFYFGAHPGDGSDFGFWMGELEDFDGLRVSDTSEVPADYSGEVLHVNDHGNVTLYSSDCGTLTEVWACV